MRPLYDRIALAHAIGVTRTTIDHYDAAGVLPEPDYRLERNGKDFWLPENVAGFVSERKRMNEERKAALEGGRL